MKRTYSQFTDTQATYIAESSFQDRANMPGKSFSKNSKYGKKFAAKAMAPYKRYRQPSTFNRTIISTTVDYDGGHAADSVLGFGFSPTKLWVNSASSTAYETQISGQWDLCRITKVEMTILPGNTTFDYSHNSAVTGERNIPIVYTAFDPNSSGSVNLAQMKQYATCKTDLLNKVVRRTFYPVLRDGDSVDVGANRKNLFMSVYKDSPFHGVLVYIDLMTQVWTYDVFRISFKVFMECRSCN